MTKETDLTKSVETALNAFNEYKTKVEDIDKKYGKQLTDFGAKLDAFDQASIKKMADTIGTVVEETQKANARQTALEEKNKQLEAALNRPGAASTEGEEKAIRKKAKKAFNEFARAKSGSSARPMYFDEFVEDKYKDDVEMKTLSANSEPAGGYLVLPEIVGPVQQFVYETSPIRQLATVTTVGTNTFEVILDNDQPSSGWVGETDARTATTTPVFQKVEIPVNELYANATATQTIIDDSIIDMESWLTQKISDRFGRDEATAFVTGSGILKPKGIMSYTSGTDTTAKQVEQVVTGDAANFTYDGIVNLQAKLKEAYQVNATFLIQRASLANIMQIKNGMGQPLFNLFPGTTGNNAGAENFLLMGKPLRFAADIAAIGSNALAMAYGDIRRAYQIVDRMGIRILRDPFTSKPNVLFYCTKRVGGGVVNFEAFKIAKIST